MFKIDALNRKYCSGETEVVTFRLPTKLKEKLQQFSEKNGRTTTDVVTTVLDQFIQATESETSTKKKSGK